MKLGPLSHQSPPSTLDTTLVRGGRTSLREVGLFMGR